MRIAIIGSRTWPDQRIIHQILGELPSHAVLLIPTIGGMPVKGAAWFAHLEGVWYDLDREYVEPPSPRFPASRTPILLGPADLILAFDADTPGTRGELEWARSRQKRIRRWVLVDGRGVERTEAQRTLFT